MTLQRQNKQHNTSETSVFQLQQILIRCATAKTLKLRRGYDLPTFPCGGFDPKLL
jgi:hypothetical protein